MNVLIDSIKIHRLEKFPNLVHGFSPRSFKIEGGSKGSLALGLRGGPRSSPEHLSWFLRSLHIESNEVCLARQVHGDRVYTIEDPSITSIQTASIEADAIVTSLRGKPVGVLTADCIPAIVYDASVPVVGVVHAGRKGSAANILFKTVGVLINRYGGKPENIVIGMGPGIGGCCYEVDEPCVLPFKKNGLPRFVKKVSRNKYLLDLFQANREDALAAGVLPENILRSGQCTSCENDRFFSYRKEGNAGRMMTVSMLC